MNNPLMTCTNSNTNFLIDLNSPSKQGTLQHNKSFSLTELQIENYIRPPTNHTQSAPEKGPTFAKHSGLPQLFCPKPINPRGQQKLFPPTASPQELPMKSWGSYSSASKISSENNSGKSSNDEEGKDDIQMRIEEPTDEELKKRSEEIEAKMEYERIVHIYEQKKKVSMKDFTLLKLLGKGSYGKVILVKKRDNGSIHAIKILSKAELKKRNQVEHTKTERSVLESVQHPNIVKMNYAFQSERKLFFVLDYCPGGELFFHLSNYGRFSEEKTKFYTCNILLALEYVHSMNVVYRDLKPENVLIDRDGYAKLTDFGLSKENILNNHMAKSFCGTPEYLAPEVLLRNGHGKAVDWWSLGALIYEMLTGLPPFYTSEVCVNGQFNRELLFNNIKGAELKYPRYLNPVVVDLLKGFFIRDPDARLGGSPRDAEEIKEHEWFEDVNWNDLLQKKILPPFRPELSSPTDTRHFDKEFTEHNFMDSPNFQLSPSCDHDLSCANKWEGFTYSEESVLHDN